MTADIKSYGPVIVSKALEIASETSVAAPTRLNAVGLLLRMTRGNFGRDARAALAQASPTLAALAETHRTAGVRSRAIKQLSRIAKITG